MNNYKNVKDEELVEVIRLKDQELYTLIVKRYQDKLLRYANYLVNDEQQSADVVQEALIKGFINLNSFDKKKKFSSWIYRIVHNEAINFITKNKKAIKLDPEFEIADTKNIEEEYFKKEITAEVAICLDKIPLKYSEVLSLYYLEEKSYDEISDILRLPIGTVGTRINRGKLIIKKICKKLK
ncbi:MAG: RNA polymerase, sigma-24 subunit, ECF subfamily [Candidatus Woesebacteria bacterium GW2011_GWA1_33_30]|uniref:RNA polymerase, sigma-24 subunit, ECF subfamily n=1 Tax=Candidatus Woesebacteria bacterium GW2011_GWA2_33_28 TaxID=1618561 RepID=A0A0G0C6A5_9BACT|nr:MAG: RNA polymerase, sigma-24 subunit, ECF subfamily [Candidatus Woesebacteria bacterium GW2011_GWA2_33_28]KKP47567.1 MAG: RNA polymerase, sigma-24 subunit, ECF subfamily [Candidatus Woesebacteria bacterium GW2011_GWA1_33_30]KKP49188.1 MAG: RNA polymerase, sigma-24 subunit, ECF subfamily [Microgenomates group bacterium GW2011_GWC1_33_32]KKP51680.1 MAG: RNA polymerase, sigma-24 subunit, ECF subfamily [Candidatus Woesebacteria bacterium GW2011_GWB1_33_38]KKP55700.1 MAG: RNA polymerase, sigma-2